MVCAAKVFLVVVSLTNGALVSRGEVVFPSMQECVVAREALQISLDKQNWVIGTPTAVCVTKFDD
ncbi:hypothetical protein JY97_00595 [Alkalispirochaeta odontotermitis]|nr:hypothetical protein JY97_00595 [Alkalispirochaeta odontotermitis]